MPTELHDASDVRHVFPFCIAFSMELCFHGVPSYPALLLLDNSLKAFLRLHFMVPYSICALEYSFCFRACDLIRVIGM